MFASSRKYGKPIKDLGKRQRRVWSRPRICHAERSVRSSSRSHPADERHRIRPLAREIGIPHAVWVIPEGINVVYGYCLSHPIDPASDLRVFPFANVTPFKSKFAGSLCPQLVCCSDLK
jgi:hypothetical protein